MGYYVTLMGNHSEFFMAKEHFDDAYKAMCELNDHDEMKRGGSWGGDGLTSRDPRPAGMDHHPARWFSWMETDYPNRYKTAPEILQALGFTVSFDKDGNMNGLAYDDKTGQEDLFLGAIAPYVRDGSRLVWQGEDGSIFAYGFGGNGEMLTMEVPIASAVQKVLDRQTLEKIVAEAVQEL